MLPYENGNKAGRETRPTSDEQMDGRKRGTGRGSVFKQTSQTNALVMAPKTRVKEWSLGRDFFSPKLRV